MWRHGAYFAAIGLGFILGILYCSHNSRRFGIDQDSVYDVMIWLIPTAIIGARLYYVLFRLDYYVQHPNEIFAIHNGGLAIYGGVIAGVLVIWLVCRSIGLTRPRAWARILFRVDPWLTTSLATFRSDSTIWSSVTVPTLRRVKV